MGSFTELLAILIVDEGLGLGILDVEPELFEAICERVRLRHGGEPADESDDDRHARIRALAAQRYGY